MRQSSLLLLNAFVLLVNFVLTWGSTSSQTAVLRTTARIAHGAPIAGPRRVAGDASNGGSRNVGSRNGGSRAVDSRAVDSGVGSVRLVKFLRRLERLPELTRRQVQAIYGALDFCAAEFARSTPVLRALDGASMRARLDVLHARLEARIRADLAAARVPAREWSGLVRIVLASTG